MATGIRGHIGLGFETTWGTGVAPTVFYPGTEDVTLEIARLRIEDPHGTRMPLPSARGRTSVRGGTRGHPVYPEAIGHILRAFCGSPTTTGTGPYTHTFLPPTAPVSGTQALPGVSVQVTKGDKTIRYTGGQLNQLTLNAPVDGYVTVDLDWIFRGADTSVGAATPTIPNEPVYAFRHLTVRRNGAPYTLVESATITLSHNLETEALQDGTLDGVAATFLGPFSAELQLTLAFRDTQAYNDFLNDAAASWEFTWASGATSLKLSFPRAVVQAYSNPLQGAGRLVATVTLVAELDQASGRVAEITLVNNRASY